MIKIGIGCDHAGFDLKLAIIKRFPKVEFIDYGCKNADISVDYPDVAIEVCQSYLEGNFDFGILICGSGIGVSITANRFTKIRAALCHNKETAILSRQHNDANFLCLGARIIDEETSFQAVRAFLDTEFLQGHHKVRVEKLTF